MRVALMIEGQEGVSWPQWLALAHAAEAAQLDGLFRSDHFRSIVRGDPEGSLDAWATLAALGAVTSTIRLGTLVSPTTFRQVSILAKLATTADHSSNGRIELGVGAGWFESEHLAYGLDFRTTRERLDELDRQLPEIIRQWTAADDIWPKPLQEPRPPIIVGGTAKPRTVAAAVAYADEYNSVGGSVEEVRERKARLDEAASAAGRAPLRLSMMTGCVVGRDHGDYERRLTEFRALTGGDRPPVAGTVDEVVEMLRAYEEAGVERVMLQHLVHEDVEMVTVMGEVAARLT